MPAGQTSPVKSLKPVSSAKCLLITQFWGFNSDTLGNFDEMKMKRDELFIDLVLSFSAGSLRSYIIHRASAKRYNVILRAECGESLQGKQQLLQRTSLLSQQTPQERFLVGFSHKCFQC